VDLRGSGPYRRRMKLAIAALLVLPSTAIAAPPSAADIRASQKLSRAVMPCTGEDADDQGKPVKVPGVTVNGFVQSLLRWTDAGGEHMAVFWLRDTIQDQTACKVQSRHMQVDVHDLKAGKPNLVRSVKEAAVPCYEDSRASFDEAITVDDVDGDGIGELTFSYTTGCLPMFKAARPVTRKLLVLEAQDKHILRGETAVKENGKVRGGAFTPEGFKKQDALLSAATKAWNKLAEDDTR
jgi:hypothetical protein